MRIAVIDIAAVSGGAKSILIEFYQYLLDTKDKNEWFFFIGEPILEEAENIHVIVKSVVKKNWINRLKYDFFDAAEDMDTVQPDVILNFQNTCIRYRKSRQYLYVHQSIPFQTTKRYSFLKRKERIYAVYQYIIGSLIKRSIRNADGIFVQTEWMREATKKYCCGSKAIVIYPEINIEKSDHEGQIAISYKDFFYPAAYMPYKNHDIIIKAVENLVTEGVTGFNVDFTIEPGESTITKPNQINCVGTQPRSTILSWYRKKIMLFPSYIETFGMPLAEARMLNGIVFAAKTPFACEILDEYPNAYFFDPFKPEELTSLMRRAISGELHVHNERISEVKEENSWSILIDTLKG